MRFTRHNPPTLAQAAQAWTDRKVAAGRWGALSLQRAREDLALFVGTDGSKSVGRVGAPFVKKYLARMADRNLALASQRSRWATAAEFGRFCWRQGWIANPWAALVEPDDLPWRGKRAKRLIGRGKAQLSGMTTARAYMDAALQLPTPAERVGALLPLLSGLRSGEIRHLHCRDVDTRAGVLWVRSEADAGGWSVKSASSARAADLPQELRADLSALCAEQAPGAYLLRSRTQAKAHKHIWLIELVARTCEAAGLPRVTPHGLRGTASSILRAQRRDDVQIGAFLGHGADRGATARDRYIGAPERTAALSLSDRNESADGGAESTTGAAMQVAISLQSQQVIMERETGFEPATSTLARSRSTAELFPQTPST